MATPQKIAAVVAAVRQSLSDDLRRPQYQGHSNPMRGHCYVASEAIWHLIGGVPHSVRIAQEVHWFIILNGKVIDATSDQFSEAPPYSLGRGRGFLTKSPSKRTQVVLNRIKTLTAK